MEDRGFIMAGTFIHRVKMKKILIAEDDQISRKMLVRVVEGLGLSAIQASDGRIAWHICLDNPDLAMVITDLAMPEVSGQDLVKLIRGNQSLAHLPIIMVSGVVSLGEIANILELGATRFLPKPVNVAHLKEYILNLSLDSRIA